MKNADGFEPINMDLNRVVVARPHGALVKVGHL